MRHFTKIKQQQQQEKTSEKIKFIKMMMAKKKQQKQAHIHSMILSPEHETNVINLSILLAAMTRKVIFCVCMSGDLTNYLPRQKKFF